jgi:hypothetical protein
MAVRALRASVFTRRKVESEARSCQSDRAKLASDRATPVPAPGATFPRHGRVSRSHGPAFPGHARGRGPPPGREYNAPGALGCAFLPMRRPAFLRFCCLLVCASPSLACGRTALDDFPLPPVFDAGVPPVREASSGVDVAQVCVPGERSPSTPRTSTGATRVTTTLETASFSRSRALLRAAPRRRSRASHRRG